MPSQSISRHRAQQDRVTRFSSDQSVDLHCHCLPAMDDGPRTWDEAITLCRAIVEDGITSAISTPHQLGFYDTQNSTALIRERVRSLNLALADAGVALEIFPGADVRLDERLLDFLSRDEVLTLADGHRYILLELPHDVLIDPTSLLLRLRPRKITAIISHPERHPAVIKRPEVVVPWLEAGAHLQVTSGSLTGAFGELARKTAWKLMVGGFVSLVASDAHGVDRPPMMSEAIEVIARKFGHGVTRRVCIENPLRVLDGRELVSARSASRLLPQGVAR